MVNFSPNDWHVSLDVRLNSGESFNIYFCEPDIADPKILDKLLKAIYEVFEILTPMAGYYDLSEVRDRVSEHLKIPEAAFDEGLNHILDLDPRPLTVGLQYEGITGRRKPLVRDRGFHPNLQPHQEGIMMLRVPKKRPATSDFSLYKTWSERLTIS